jgi:hypothetical protein
VTPVGQATMTWSWNPGANRWNTTATIGGTKLPLSAGSVLVQQVAFKAANSRAAPVQTADVFGTGKLTAFSAGGQVVDGSWNKSGLLAATLYRDPSAAPLRLGAGPVVVLLVPAGSTVSPT